MWTENELRFLEQALIPALKKANFLYIKHCPIIKQKHPFLTASLNDFAKDKRDILINIGPFYPNHRPTEEFVTAFIRTANEHLAKRYYNTRLVVKSFSMMGFDKKKNGVTSLDCLRIVCMLSEDF